MYENKYNLTSRPFNLAPTIQNFFAADGINQAIVQARTCIERETGPVIITGSPGTGKSLLLAMLEKQYSGTHRVVCLQCTRLVERSDLLQSILYELELPYRDLSEGELRLSLIDFLKTDESRGLLLLVDEAHGLSTGLLDELRLITNFVRDGRQRVSLVMSGSPSLEDHLIDTRCESFNQRIAARCYLGSLTQKETFEYILTHVERAGGNGEELFTDQALSSVHEASDGCPRVINQICDQSLMIAAQFGADRVSAEIVAEAWNQVQSMPGSSMGQFSSGSAIETESQSTSSADHLVEPSTGGSEMVIEFGQLDGEETQPVYCESNEDPIVSVDATQSVEEFTWIATETQELTADTSENLIPIDFGTAETSNSQQWHIHDESMSETIDTNPAFGDNQTSQPSVDSLQDQQLVVQSAQQDFENPFEEVFTEEERIPTNFVPAVAEQNISSLTLHPEQLSFLSEMPANTEMSASPKIAGFEAPSGQDIPQYSHENDLTISEESLPSIEEIEADVVRMQHDIYTQAAESGGYQPPIATEDTGSLNQIESQDSDAAPLAFHEQIPQQSEQEPFAIPDVAAIARQIAMQDAEIRSQEEPALQSEDPPKITPDDRDMMIVEIQNDPTQMQHSTHRSDDRSVPITSTGIAKRMDYQELFQQLRNQNQ